MGAKKLEPKFHIEGAVPIHSCFKPLYESNKRYFLVTGGRGGLKSSTVHDFVARLTYEKGHGILFTRYTMTSASISIIPEFQETLERLKISNDFHVTKNMVINKKTKSFIYFSGIKAGSKDMTGRLKSISGITTWIIEEGEDFKDEKAFDIIDDSIRTPSAQNRVIWIQNPTTREHFIYKKFIKDTNKQIDVEGYNVTVSNHRDVEHIHTTYRLAESLGYLDKGWLKKANDSMMEANLMQIKYTLAKKSGDSSNIKGKHESHYYFNYIGGWLERAEGAIFKNWSFGKFDTTLPSCFALDFGYHPDPLAMPKIAVDKKNKKIYIKQYIHETMLDDVPLRLHQVGVRKKKDLIVCDTNEERTRQQIKKAGYNIQKAKKNEISEDIRFINQFEIIVDNTDNCSKDVVTELNNYEWNDKKSSIPIDDWNHQMDAMRYGVVRLTRKQVGGVKRRN